MFISIIQHNTEPKMCQMGTFITTYEQTLITA